MRKREVCRESVPRHGAWEDTRVGAKGCGVRWRARSPRPPRPRPVLCSGGGGGGAHASGIGVLKIRSQVLTQLPRMAELLNITFKE